MSSRRQFLRMLGAASVGTLAHDQLSYLVRQPHSVELFKYPYCTTLRVQGLTDALDSVSIWQSDSSGHKLIWKSSSVGGELWTKAKDQIEIPVMVHDADCESMLLKRTNKIMMPKKGVLSDFGLSHVKQEGVPVIFDTHLDPDAWVEQETNQSHAFAIERGGVLVGDRLTVADVIEFEDL